MIDELDLAFDERVEKGRHRRSFMRKRNRKRGGGRGRTIAALTVMLLLLGGLGGGVWYGFDRLQGFFVTPDYDGPGTGETVVEVKPADSVTDVGNTLYKADVVKSAKAYIKVADNERGRGVQVGFYKLRKQMKAADALALMLDPASRVTNRLTIPEGAITLKVFADLSKLTNIPVEEFKKAAADPVKLGVPEFWFERQDGKKSARSLEGFLFPATYELPPKATAAQLLTMMVNQFLQVTKEMKFVETVQAERAISPYEALITASIAQAESVNPEDMPKVSRVIYNRVYTDRYPCRCLQIDSAVNYWLRLQGKDPKDSDDLFQSELTDKKNPYNTHVVAGLPVGPISNPGEVALRGAMQPTDGPWVYFMTVDKKGTMGYGSTDADFKKLRQQMCANGVLSGENC
jgi:UPF0755 protein